MAPERKQGLLAQRADLHPDWMLPQQGQGQMMGKLSLPLGFSVGLIPNKEANVYMNFLQIIPGFFKEVK